MTLEERIKLIIGDLVVSKLAAELEIEKLKKRLPPEEDSVKQEEK